MKIINTFVHGIMDYVVGTVLMVAPWALGFARDGAETWIPVILGAGAFVYSLFTRYELGAVKKLPMTTHLTLDFISGALLAASPWLFGFADFVHLPHLVLGVVEMGTALMTDTHSSTERFAHAH